METENLKYFRKKSYIKTCNDIQLVFTDVNKYKFRNTKNKHN